MPAAWAAAAAVDAYAPATTAAAAAAAAAAAPTSAAPPAAAAPTAAGDIATAAATTPTAAFALLGPLRVNIEGGEFETGNLGVRAFADASKAPRGVFFLPTSRVILSCLVHHFSSRYR